MRLLPAAGRLTKKWRGEINHGKGEKRMTERERRKEEEEQAFSFSLSVYWKSDGGKVGRK